MRNIDKVRAKSTVHRIYELFENDGRAIRKIPAIDALSQLKGSHVTIIKARHMLGVESKKIAGKWVWFYPNSLSKKLWERKRRSSTYVWVPALMEPGKVRFDLPAGTRKLRCPYCGGKNIRLTKAWNKEAEALERTLRFGHYDVESKKVVHALRRYLKSKIYSAMNEHARHISLQSCGRHLALVSHSPGNSRLAGEYDVYPRWADKRTGITKHGAQR